MSYHHLGPDHQDSPGIWNAVRQFFGVTERAPDAKSGPYTPVPAPPQGYTGWWETPCGRYFYGDDGKLLAAVEWGEPLAAPSLAERLAKLEGGFAEGGVLHDYTQDEDSVRAQLSEPMTARITDEQTARTVNPKEAAGSKKPGIWSVFPRWVSLLVGRVMETGASKYGRFNYRDSAIAASTYEDAMERHAMLWFDGEDNDPESGVSHLAHVIACATLLLDAQATGKLVDNRQKTGLIRTKLEELEALRKTLPFPGNKL